MARWLAALRNARPGGIPAADAVLAGLLLLVAVASVLAGKPDEGPPAVTLPAAVAMTGPLAWRRKSPLVPALACASANLFQAALAQAPGTLWSLVAFAVAMYSVAAWSTEGLAAVGGGVLLAALLVGEWLADGPDYLFIVLLFGGTWLLGRAARIWRGRLGHQQQHELDAARLAVAEERLRIARELHDVLGHSMSVIAVQADAAGAALDSAPELAREPLAAIHATARGSLAEIRTMLDVLHGEAGGDGGAAGSPGLADLQTLLDSSRLAGLEVTGRIDAGLPDLSPAAGLVLFRVVQESLTNVLKHAGPVAAGVLLIPAGNAVQLEIRNEPGAVAVAAESPKGYGLRGLGERVRQLGGTFAAGPEADGGWLVTAVVPATAPSSAAQAGIAARP